MSDVKHQNRPQEGSQAPDRTSLNRAGSLAELLNQMKNNYLEYDIEPVEGLIFNQYDLLRLVNLYINSKFEGGPVDEHGNDKYFHNIINHRCAHATKNIDLDTKDIYVVNDGERGYPASFIMRAKLRCWMRDTGFADKLNRLADNLPKYGAVIWKKKKRSETEEKYPSGIDVEPVDLMDVIFDPAVKRIKDSSIFAERHLMHPQEVRDMAEFGWDEDVIEEIIKGQASAIKKSHFMRERSSSDVAQYSVTDTIPTIELFEMYGWVPETAIPEAWRKDAGMSKDPDPGKYVYVMAVLDAPTGEAGGRVAFLKALDPKDFPYKDCLLPVRAEKRWLPFSISELLVDLQIRANELVYRFFRALRSGSLHLFQTRSNTIHSNLFQDAEDGDIIVSKARIEPIALELRAFNQYQTELGNIETQADKIANTFEVITGENLPTNTPFRLGAQLNANANKIYEHVREECGDFLSEVFNEWIMPDIIETLEEDEILEVFGSVEELKFFDEAYRRSKMFESVKEYVLKSGHLPTKTEFATVEKLFAEEMDNADRKVKITKDFLENALKYSIRFDVTGETTNREAESETLGNLFQILASNPAVIQDPTARVLMARIMEAAGISPIQFAGFASQPLPETPPAGAVPPAEKAFGGNQTTTGIMPERAVSQSEAV